MVYTNCVLQVHASTIKQRCSSQQLHPQYLQLRRRNRRPASHQRHWQRMALHGAGHHMLDQCLLRYLGDEKVWAAVED